LLLPAGVMMSLADLPIGKKNIRFWITSVSVASLLSWAGFAWIQHSSDLSLVFDSRELMTSKREARFCVQQKHLTKSLNGKEEGIHTISGTLVNNNIFGTKGIKCWNKDQFKRDFAGLPYTQQIANGMGVIFKNERPGKTFFYEQWDSNQATESGMKEWVTQEAKSINGLKIPYMIERLEIKDYELEAPGYASWKQQRKKRLKLLTQEIGAIYIGRLGSIGIWKTKWAPATPLESQNE